MFANYLIGLREGFEAALIVAILVAYLVRSGDRRAVRLAWLGVGVAVAVSVAVGLLLTLIDEALSEQAATAFAGAMSLVAVGLITWMVFWMAARAKGIKQHLHGEMDRALAASGVAIAAVAFAAVTREGVETALFLWAGIRSSGSTATPVLGAVLGLATAVLLGVLMYRGAIRLNMARLFTWTGAALIVVAGGVLRYAVAEFQELGWLPGEDSTAFDLSGVIAPDGVVGTIIRGTVNLTPTMNWLEVFVWLLYVVPTLVIFFSVISRRRRETQYTTTRVPINA
jgi:high-affinity iron transporter